MLRWSCAQPGVDDQEISQLVEEKVDAFWKGVEGDANKRGQVRPNPCLCADNPGLTA